MSSASSRTTIEVYTLAPAGEPEYRVMSSASSRTTIEVYTLAPAYAKCTGDASGYEMRHYAKDALEG